MGNIWRRQMNIYSTSTTRFWTEPHKDGLHMINEIDDDDFGLKSEVHYIISPETTKKLFSVISQKDFFELCKKKEAHYILLLRNDIL